MTLCLNLSDYFPHSAVPVLTLTVFEGKHVCQAHKLLTCSHNCVTAHSCYGEVDHLPATQRNLTRKTSALVDSLSCWGDDTEVPSKKEKRLKHTVIDYRTGRVSQNIHLTDSHKWEAMLHVVHCRYNTFNNTSPQRTQLLELLLRVFSDVSYTQHLKVKKEESDTVKSG